MPRILDRDAGVRRFDLAADPFEAIEFELHLDLEDPLLKPFERCVRDAAQATGGRVLFDMPAEPSLDDASRIAAVSFASRVGARLAFAVLSADGRTIRLARRDEVGERFFGFARAYLGIVDRLGHPPRTAG